MNQRHVVSWNAKNAFNRAETLLEKSVSTITTKKKEAWKCYYEHLLLNKEQNYHK